MTFTKASGAALVTAACGVLLVLNVRLQPARYATRSAAERVIPLPMALVVRAPGTIEAKDSSTVRAQFDAQIEKKLFREGQKVIAGERLVVLDREKIRLEYQSKTDALANAQSDLVKARKEVRLQRALFSKQAVAYSAVEDATRAVVKAEQTLRGAKESFRQAQLQWNSAVVTAPIGGTVVKDWVGDEKVVSSGKEIVTVADVSEFSVRVLIDELDIKRVKEGQVAEVRIQSLPGALIHGRVTQIGSAMETAGALPQVPVILRLTDPGETELRPKLTAEARIQAGVTEPILSVPLDALANAEGETRVWVIDGLNRLRSRRVDVGRTTTERAEILKGIEAGERIAAAAEPDFSEGMQVVIDQAGARRDRTKVLMSRLKEKPPLSLRGVNGSRRRPVP